MKDSELKDREKKLKKRWKNYFLNRLLCLKMIWIGLKKKEMKIRPIKNAWYDWLINYIVEPIRNSVGGLKDKIVSLFKTNTPKPTVYG